MCNLDKPLNEFYKRKNSKDGYRNDCKVCNISKSKKYYDDNIVDIAEKGKIYRNNNPDKIYERNRAYIENNQEKVAEYNKTYREVNLEDIKSYQKEYKKNNRDIRNIKHRERYLNDSLYRITHSIRGSISNVLRTKGYKKSSKTCDILGCSFEEFKQHIESQWEDWMNWDNYGNPKDGILELDKTWDLDHIICISSAKSEEDVIRLNHYTNFQPLCSYNNRFIKSANYMCFSPIP